MARQANSDPMETAEERLLRATYNERAPQHIETDRAWAAVAPRLLLQAASVRPGGRVWVHSTQSGGRRRFGWLGRLGLAAAVVALPIALMGVGFVKERLTPLDPGMQRIADEGLYHAVGQSQTVDGVTITVTNAYADEGRTVIYYRVQMSPALAQSNRNALIGSWDLSDARGVEPTGGIGTCSAWDSVTRSSSCYMIAGPLHPAASASDITLTLDITTVYLTQTDGAQGDAHGHWRFLFTTPYHHINVGSVEQFFPHLLHLAPTSSQP